MLQLSTDPLSNHIATVEEYLGEYKKKETPKDRRLYFFGFGAYLVGQCWMKMRRRILHWSSQGFIYILGKIDEAEVLMAFTSYEQSDARRELPKGRDSDLGKLLIGMHENGEIGSVIMSQCGRPELCSERLTNLITAFESPPPPPGDEQRIGLDVYKKETCWEFHRFLLATILAYGKSLDALGSLNARIRPNPRRGKKEMLSPAELERLKLLQIEHAEQTRLCSIVLWRLAYSRVLKHHLRALGMGGYLDQPRVTLEKLDKYRRSTTFSTIDCPDLHWRGDGGDGDMAEKEDSKNNREDASGDKEDAREDQEDARNDQEDANAQEEEHLFVRSSGPSSAYKLAEMFQKWISLNVTHWAALSILSSNAHFNLNSKSLKISLVAVKHPNPNNDLPIEPWRVTLSSLLADEPHNSTQVISMITKYIDRARREKSNGKGTHKWANSIFYAFENGPNRVKSVSTTHCEAALVAIKKCPTEWHSADVKTLVKVSG
jgi:hypothetical protein